MSPVPAWISPCSYPTNTLLPSNPPISNQLSLPMPTQLSYPLVPTQLSPTLLYPPNSLLHSCTHTTLSYPPIPTQLSPTLLYPPNSLLPSCTHPTLSYILLLNHTLLPLLPNPTSYIQPTLSSYTHPTLPIPTQLDLSYPHIPTQLTLSYPPTAHLLSPPTLFVYRLFILTATTKELWRAILIGQLSSVPVMDSSKLGVASIVCWRL
jgi:hypothetical protein